MYKIELTKEEIDAAIIQLGARLDALKQVQLEAGKKGNIESVIEIEKFMQPIISAKEKMMSERYK
jgi:hypothetical protein